MKKTVEEIIDFLTDNYELDDDLAVIIWESDDIKEEAEKKGIENLTDDEIDYVLETVVNSGPDWTAVHDGLQSVLDSRKCDTSTI